MSLDSLSMKISEIMSRTVFTAQPDMQLYDVATKMATENIGAVPIMVDSKVVGIFTERDMMSRVISKGINPCGMRVADVS